VGFQARAALCTLTIQSTSAPLQGAPLETSPASHDGATYMHIGVWKSLIFLQASRQKNKKEEGSGWRFLQKLPSFTKKHTKTSLFYKKNMPKRPKKIGGCGVD
jgi:hypothetical protein